jgi:hypothetical protein
VQNRHQHELKGSITSIGGNAGSRVSERHRRIDEVNDRSIRTKSGMTRTIEQDYSIENLELQLNNRINR